MNRPTRNALSRCVLCLIFAGFFACSAKASTDAGVFTLYRNSTVDAEMRLQIATFDAKDGEAYNRGNCWIAAELFKGQPGVKVRYWCEKGRFRE